MILNQLYLFLSNRVMTFILSVSLLFLVVSTSVDVYEDGRVTSTLADLQSKGHRITLEQFREPRCDMDKNAAPFYKAAMELTTTTRLSFGQPVAEVANEHPEIVSQLHGALDLLTQASERPSCWMNLHVDQGFRMPSPNFMQFRNLIIVGAVDAVLKQREGHTDLAVARCIELCRATRRVDLGCGVIGFAFRNSSTQRLLSALETLPAGSVGANPLLKDELTLLRDELSKGLLSSIDGEVAMSAQLFRDIRSRKASEVQSIDVMPSADSENAMLGGLAFRIGGAWLSCVDELSYLQAMTTQYDQAAHGEQPNVKIEHTFPYVMTAVLTPNTGRLWKQQQESLSRIDTLLR